MKKRLALIYDELAAIRHAAYACSADNDTTEPLCNLIEQVQNLAAVVSWMVNDMGEQTP